MSSWREWFVPPEDTEDPADTEHSRRMAAAYVAGSSTTDGDLLLSTKKVQPRCVSCKEFMGYSSGMYIMIADPWRLHISCFSKVVEERFEQGEIIDLTTGTIHKLDPEAEEE